ncbi:MAG: lysophospholipase [Gemmatimonadaceae bacterium]|nr:lysophospholipase [Gemmatimonadaceae bacterium]
MIHLMFRGKRPTPALIAATLFGLVLGFVVNFWARRAGAQQAPVTFVYLQNADTVGVETVTPGQGVVRGTLGFRGQPRVEWEQQRQPMQLTLRVFAPGAAESAAPAQQFVFHLRGDSMAVDITANGQTRTQMAASKANAVPLMGQSVLHAALMAQYARSQGLTTLPVFMTSGGQTLEASVQFTGDSSVFTVAGLPIRTQWVDGQPQEIRIPAQNLRVVRATGAVKPPAPVKIDYSAPADAPYTAEHVVIPTTRGYTLAGTLTKPKGVAKAPVMITISGSGPQERDERLGSVLPGYAIFREIADTLGRRGIAVLRYDDRGVGESGGADSRAKATSADFADDAQSVIAYLRTRPDIDATRIIVSGHSEGGLIGPLVAVREPAVRGLVMLAGPAYDGRRVLQYQIGNQFKALAAAKSTADSGLANAMARGDDLSTYIRTRTDKMIDSMRVEPWMQYFVDTDPKATLRQVTQPVLVLQGGTDMQVTPEQADTVVAVLRAAGNRRVTSKVFPATNHLFVPDPSGVPSEYPKLKDVKVRREVLGAVADWVAALVR